jgi:hypothetical protein
MIGNHRRQTVDASLLQGGQGSVGGTLVLGRRTLPYPQQHYTDTFTSRSNAPEFPLHILIVVRGMQLAKFEDEVDQFFLALERHRGQLHPQTFGKHKDQPNYTHMFFVTDVVIYCTFMAVAEPVLSKGRCRVLQCRYIIHLSPH